MKAGKTTPESDYLTGPGGKSVSVTGTWVPYKCKWGLVEAFLIEEQQYQDLNKQCQAKGYEFAQPSDDAHPATYPFQYDLILGQFYRHRTPFSFNKIPETPADRCMGEDRRRRRNRNRNRRIH